jgi:prepilin-type N-terminal cleavage/methylation domain-containing protein
LEIIMKNFKKKQDGFTLLELLVVVAILATIGGAVVGTFGNQEQNAAQGTATNTIAALENSVRVYEATQGQLPDDLESLACRPYTEADGLPAAITTVVNGPSITLNDTGSAYKIGGGSNLNGISGGLGFKLADKFDLVAIPDISGLTDAGISTVRYGATMACDETVDDVEMGFAAGLVAKEGAKVTGKLSEVTIPNHMFEGPRTGDNRNRGRGFSVTLADNDPLMVWKDGTGGYNNIKVGGEEQDVLVGLGIGQASTMVGTNSEAMLAKAPFYGQIARDKYAHYIALVKIGTSTTGDVATNFTASAGKVVAVIDARGDFLDEEIAEFTDQKQ